MKKFSARMWLAAVLGALAFIGGTGLTISSGWLITMAWQQPPIMTLTVSIVMIRFFGIFRSVARYAERILSHEAVFRRLTSLRVSLFQRLSRSGVELSRDVNSGKTVKAIVDDVERAQEFQLRVTLPFRSALIAVVTGVALGYWIRRESLYFTVPAAVLTLLIIPWHIKQTCSKAAEGIEELESAYSQAIVDSAEGMIEAKMYGYLDATLGQAHKSEENLLLREIKLAKRSSKANFLTLLVIGAAITASLVITRDLQERSEIPLVGITMLIFLPLVFFESITAWYPNLFAAGKLIVAQRRIDTLSTTDIRNLHIQASLLERVKDLSVRDLQVSWGVQFMKPLSFSATPGSSIVLRGPSGVGKSTLAMGLLGALEYRGSATVNGCEISSISNLDQIVVGSLQQGHIFNTTVRENLKIADHAASDSELHRVLAMVELDDISLDSVVGEFGRPLSGGEAKRLGLARALLSPAPILIFDEPTEHLDHELAARIEERVLERYADRILIIITHSGWGKAGRTVTLARE
jgi:thiol reductant ABC exporter CydC subunit